MSVQSRPHRVPYFAIPHARTLRNARLARRVQIPGLNVLGHKVRGQQRSQRRALQLVLIVPEKKQTKKNETFASTAQKDPPHATTPRTYG